MQYEVIVGSMPAITAELVTQFCENKHMNGVIKAKPRMLVGGSAQSIMVPMGLVELDVWERAQGFNELVSRAWCRQAGASLYTILGASSSGGLCGKCLLLADCCCLQLVTVLEEKEAAVVAVAEAAAVLGDKEERLAEAVAAVEQGPPGSCDSELLAAVAAADQDLEDAKEAHSEAAVAASALVNEVSFELRCIPVLASL